MNTDVESVRQWKRGEKNGFDELYEKYKTQALRTAFLICKSIPDSEDIVQDTFVQCHVHIRELKKEKEFKSWMMRILTHEAYKVLKKKYREQPDEEIDKKMNSVVVPGILEEELKKERLDSIGKAIDKLSDKHKITVIHYYYNEMSVREIAKVMGCLEGTVKSRLHTARKQLKNFLEKEEMI